MTLQNTWNRIKKTVRQKCLHNVLNFIFIIAFINVFQAVFGPENSILAVSLTILMPASTVRDMTATPVKHLCVQTVILELMVVSAFLVQSLQPWAALPLNLATLLIILYAYTYEYSSSMYFPYILSYLFFLFISPVTAEQLPRRMLGALAGAVCTILYQFYSNRTRVTETAHDRLTAMLEQARRAVDFRLTGTGGDPDLALVRESVCVVSRAVYERRRKALRISDAGFALVDAARTLEHLILLVRALPGDPSPAQAAFLSRLGPWLDDCRDFVLRLRPDLPATDWGADAPPELREAADYLRARLGHMADRERRRNYRPTGLSLWIRVKAAMDVSSVRVTYAIRTAVLLAVGTLLVQLLGVTHGKWILFTVASLSLPYADDIGTKTWKRVLGTLAGGAVSVVVYSLFPAAEVRTFFMMFSGFLTGFFSDYAQTYACSTVGALGGAVFLTTFGWGAVSAMFGLRVLYILLGALIVFLFCRLLAPFTRHTASEQLTAKYVRLSDLLARVCAQDAVDAQLYYSLVIQAQLTEQKLRENAGKDGQMEALIPVLAECHRRVRDAHLAAVPAQA